MNVEIIVTETEEVTTIRLQDEVGVIVEIPMEEVGRERTSSSPTRESEAGGEPAEPRIETHVAHDDDGGARGDGTDEIASDEDETSRALEDLRAELESARNHAADWNWN